MTKTTPPPWKIDPRDRMDVVAIIAEDDSPHDSWVALVNKKNIGDAELIVRAVNFYLAKEKEARA